MEDDFSSSVVIRRRAFSRALGRVEYFDFFFGGCLEMVEDGGGGGKRFLEVDGCICVTDFGSNNGVGLGTVFSDAGRSTIEG